MSIWELTKTTQFLVRPLGLVRITEYFNETCEIRYRYGFINAYIADKDHINTLKCPVYTLFRPHMPIAFQAFIDRQYEKGLLKEDYNYEGGYVVLLYEFPQELQKDYHKILESKYSQVSEAFKSIFPEFSPDGQNTLQFLVFTRHPKLRHYREETLGVVLDENAELLSIMRPEEEILDISKLSS